MLWSEDLLSPHLGLCTPLFKRLVEICLLTLRSSVPNSLVRQQQGNSKGPQHLFSGVDRDQTDLQSPITSGSSHQILHLFAAT